MNMIPVFALMLAPNPPLPLNETQLRDIGCVAAIGIIAHEQRSGQNAAQSFPDVRESGKRWAGIVGERVMEESGQPREVVAFAIKKAVEAEQAKVIGMDDDAQSKNYVRRRFAECQSVMDRQLTAADASTPAAAVDNGPSMLAAQPDWQTDEPDKIALFRTQMGEDLGSPHRIRYCKTLVDIAYNDILGREGADSRDAKAFGRLAQAFASKVIGLRAAEKPKPVSAEQLQAELEKEPSNEEKMARCLRLGESLALAMPPE